jgi:hypothetical protein
MKKIYTLCVLCGEQNSGSQADSLVLAPYITRFVPLSQETGSKIGQILFSVISACYRCYFGPSRTLYPIFPERGVREEEGLYQQLEKNYIVWTLFSHGSGSVGCVYWVCWVIEPP